MKTLTQATLMAVALATAAVPLAAEAQSRDRYERDYRYDRRDRDDRSDRHDRRDRRDWNRGNHNGWDNDHRWNRNDRNWWRGRSDFRDYHGARSGYWYAPSYGYYRVEPRYYSQHWTRGSYLPNAYRNYYVRDPYVYGLRPAPRGYRYVHANNDIVMIAIATGLIASVLTNVY